MPRTVREVPGFLTVAGVGARLGLAARSVRDLIYTGRLPSERLGRFHYLRVSDVERERRRRLGLPLPRPARPRQPAARASRPTSASRGAGTMVALLPQPARDQATAPGAEPRPDAATSGTAARPGRGSAGARATNAAARRARAEQRARLFERWLRAGHRPQEPELPFRVLATAAATTCGACGRAVRPGSRMIDVAPADGLSAARLCLSCGRRALLSWADRRRREAAAARQLARGVGAPGPAADPPAPSRLVA